MTLPVEDERVTKAVEKIQSLRRGSFKTVFYVVVLAVSLSVLNFLFGWTSSEAIPSTLQPFSGIILFVNPYLPYIQAVLVFALGYLAVNALSGMAYTYTRRITDHPTLF